MKTTEITLLKKGVNSDINILEPEAQENILGGATKCDQGYRHSILYGTKCSCGMTMDIYAIHQLPLILRKVHINHSCNNALCRRIIFIPKSNIN